MSETVNLSKNIKLKYPNWCVVCRQKGNLKWFAIRGEAVGGGGFEKWMMGKSGKRNIPLHISCAKKLRRQRFWRNVGILMLATALAVFWFAMGNSGVRMPFEFNKTTLCIAGVILFLPILIAEELRPSPIEFREDGNLVTFDFKDREYAEEFAKLNGTEIGYFTEFNEESVDTAGLCQRVEKHSKRRWVNRIKRNFYKHR